MPRSLSNFTARFGRVLVLLALFSAMAPTIDDAWGAGRIETFGPGSVDCQRLDESHVNCLLSALRITQDNKNVVAFDIAALPRKEQAIFRKWCSAGGDSCICDDKGNKRSAGRHELVDDFLDTLDAAQRAQEPGRRPSLEELTNRDRPTHIAWADPPGSRRPRAWPADPRPRNPCSFGLFRSQSGQRGCKVRRV